MKKLRDIFVSAVVVITDSKKENIEKLSEILDVLADNYAYYEVVAIDTESNSADFSSLMGDELKKLAKVRYIRLFNVISDKVIFAAGMENAIGDVVIASYPEYYCKENIVDAVNLCCAGNDLVSGVSTKRKSLLYSSGSWLFRKSFGKMINYKQPTNDLPFRCVSRRLINAALNMDHFHEFVFLKLANAGGQQTEFSLQNIDSEWHRDSILKGFSKLVSLLVFNTTVPLRIINMLALCSSFAALLFAAYSIAVKLIKKHVIEGWPTTMLVISGLFFMLFLILAFIGEYMVRLITDHGKTVSYNVIFEKHSSVMLDYNKLNVREDSTSSEINRTQTGRDR